MAAWEENVRKVVPYTPGEQPEHLDIIKLNTNENPYPPAPKAAEILKKMDAEILRRYPDPAAGELVQALAERYKVPREQVFVGVGSDDVLAMSFLTFFSGGKPIFFPDITYSFYDVWADLFRIPYECQPLDEQFQIRTTDYLRDCGGIVIPNPNAPTGIEKDLAQLEQIVAANPGVIVIIDEAYIDFGGESALKLVPKYDNLLVVQTFSKSRSLAGMRIGYAFGDEKLIKYLNDAKYSFNSYTMDTVTIAMGAASLRDEAYFRETIGKVTATREWTKKELTRLGFVFPDSKSNFIFASHPKCPAKELFEALKEQGIYVRYFDKPRIDQYLRISIGTDLEMQTLIQFLEQYLGENV
ncbi:MAG: histidinol-phosphate transaminase [Lachnospiraceae bacterium]|nr:histidinol-phosphate transaminase [Lachnospiraceae bacterium]